MDASEMVFKGIVIVVMVVFVYAIHAWVATPGTRRTVENGRLVLNYSNTVVVGFSCFGWFGCIGAVGVALSRPYQFWDEYPIYLGVFALGAGAGAAIYASMRKSQAEIDPKGLTNVSWLGGRFTARWDEIERVDIDTNNDLAFRTVGGKTLVVARWYVGFPDSLPLFLAYLPEPAKIQFSNLLVSR